MTRSVSLCLTLALFACLLCLPGCGGGGGGEAEFVQPGPGEGPTDEEVQAQLELSDQQSKKFQESYGRPGN